MNTDDIDAQVHEFYDSKSLTRDQLRELRDTMDGPQSHIALGRPRRGVAPLSMAAAIALAFGAGIIVDRYATGAHPAQSSDATLPPAAGLQSRPIVAFRLHADWCRPSQEMAPRCAQLVQEFGRENVLFVDLDVTDEVTTAQSKRLAQSLGVLEAWTEVGAHSGELVIVDRREGQTIESFTIENDYTSMSVALTQMLATTAPVGAGD